MSMRSMIAATILALSLLLPAAWAGPFADFEKDLNGSYAIYRVSLFETNRKDKAATEAALRSLQASWQALSLRWAGSPPPHYANDADFVPTLNRVGQTIAKATAETDSGKLVEAHETLETIRDELSELRRRNGIINFSDRMNAYHERMEKILLDSYDGFSPAGLGALREDAAILNAMYQEIEHNTPKDLANRPDFIAARKAVKDSVEALLTSARSADPAQVRQAIAGLKKPYSLLFLKFG